MTNITNKNIKINLKYNYNDNCSSIRLIKITEYFDHIYVNIINNKENVKYIAISHTWETEEQINIKNNIKNGYLLENTKMYRIIKSVIKLDINFFWIDTLCINQLDNDDKSYWVPKMGKIYKNAYGILIYLTENNNQDKYFINNKNIQNINEKYKNKIIKMENTLINFLNDRWITRIWTLQEIILGKIDKIWISFKDNSIIHFYDIIKYFKFFEKNYEFLDNTINFNFNYTNLETIVNYLTLKPEKKRKLHANEYIKMIQKRYCSNDLDYFFGGLGIIHGGETFTINYNWTYDEALLKFNEHIVKFDPTIIFNYCKNNNCSWVFSPKDINIINNTYNNKRNIKSIKIQKILNNKIYFNNKFTISIPSELINCEIFCSKDDKNIIDKDINQSLIIYCKKLIKWCNKNKIDMSLLIGNNDKKNILINNNYNINKYINQQINLLNENDINDEKMSLLLDIAYGNYNNDLLCLIEINNIKYIYPFEMLTQNNIENIKCRILILGDNSIEQTLITKYDEEKNIHYKIGLGLKPLNSHILKVFKNLNLEIILG